MLPIILTYEYIILYISSHDGYKYKLCDIIVEIYFVGGIDMDIIEKEKLRLDLLKELYDLYCESGDGKQINQDDLRKDIETKLAYQYLSSAGLINETNNNPQFISYIINNNGINLIEKKIIKSNRKELIDNFLNDLNMILNNDAPELTPQQIGDIKVDAEEALVKIIERI